VRRLAQRASAGDQLALAELMTVLDGNPESCHTIGDLERHAELVLIRMIAGDDVLLSECLRRNFARKRCELGFDTATPLERCAIQQWVACWCRMRHADVQAAQPVESIREQLWLSRLQDSAHRRFASATQMLLLVRRAEAASGNPPVPRLPTDMQEAPAEATSVAQPVTVPEPSPLPSIGDVSSIDMANVDCRAGATPASPAVAEVTAEDNGRPGNGHAPEVAHINGRGHPNHGSERIDPSKLKHRQPRGKRRPLQPSAWPRESYAGDEPCSEPFVPVDQRTRCGWHMLARVDGTTDLPDEPTDARPSVEDEEVDLNLVAFGVRSPALVSLHERMKHDVAQLLKGTPATCTDEASDALDNSGGK
jgi:hypothetical protein